LASTPAAWARASALESPIEEPSRTEPCRDSAPLRPRMLSSKVVLPLWNGPTSAINRGPLTRLSPFWVSLMVLAPLMVCARYVLLLVANISRGGGNANVFGGVVRVQVNPLPDQTD